MPEPKSAKKATRPSAKGATAKRSTTKRATAARGSKYGGFSAGERAAMKEYASELKRQASGKSDGETDVLAAIAKMQEPDRAMAERFHALVKKVAPELAPRTWYGMPAYAKNGKVVCFFRDAHKFKERYSMLGFNDSARLDDGAMWPVAYALEKMTPAEENKISALLKKAVGSSPA